MRIIRRGRGGVPVVVQYIVGFLILAWTFRTYTFLTGSLHPSSAATKRAFTQDEDGDDLSTDEDDNDNLGSAKPDRRSKANSGNEQTNQADSQKEDDEGPINRKLHAFFVSDYKRGDFWINTFSKSKKYSQAISWSDPRVTWFLGGQCAVKTFDLDDRFTVNCEEQPLVRALLQSKHQKIRAVSSRLHKLTKVRGRHCPRLEDFLRKPLQDIDLQTSRLIKPDEMLLVHDTVQATETIVASARDVKKALRHSNRLVVEKLTSNPLLLSGKKFALRAWIFPLRSHKPLLAYFGLGDVAVARAKFDSTSESKDVHVPSEPGAKCFEDLKALSEVPPQEMLLPHLKRIALLVLASASDPGTKQRSHDDAFVLSPPICLDFEFDQSSRVWLIDWNIGDRCLAGHAASTCASSVNLDHYLDLGDAFSNFSNGDFEAKQKFKSLELLVDEAQFSEAEEEICDSNSTPYERFVNQRRIIQERVKHAVFRDGDGKPKTTHQAHSDSKGFKCPKCGYLNHHRSPYCDLCGTRLAASLLQEPDSKKQRYMDDPNNYRARLAALFQQHDPQRISNIDVLLDRYRGEEEALILRLTRQYAALSKHA